MEACGAEGNQYGDEAEDLCPCRLLAFENCRKQEWFSSGRKTNGRVPIDRDAIRGREEIALDIVDHFLAIDGKFISIASNLDQTLWHHLLECSDIHASHATVRRNGPTVQKTKSDKQQATHSFTREGGDNALRHRRDGARIEDNRQVKAVAVANSRHPRPLTRQDRARKHLVDAPPGQRAGPAARGGSTSRAGVVPNKPL